MPPMSHHAIAYRAAINAAAIFAMAADKRRAIQRRPRIPERSLLLLALAGGGPGAVAAQQTLRHKTRKQPFCGLLLLIAAGQVIGLAWLVARLAGG